MKPSKEDWKRESTSLFQKVKEEDKFLLSISRTRESTPTSLGTSWWNWQKDTQAVISIMSVEKPLTCQWEGSYWTQMGCLWINSRMSTSWKRISMFPLLWTISYQLWKMFKSRSERVISIGSKSGWKNLAQSDKCLC